MKKLLILVFLIFFVIITNIGCTQTIHRINNNSDADADSAEFPESYKLIEAP
ncbi:hypothetical protein GMMP13_680023 [Candidatus Magnetomoraceae bacterium gMMP-13]